MLFDNVQSWCLLSVILDDDTRASANFSWFAFLVNFAQAAPLSQLLAAVNFEHWDLVLIAECGDELLVLRLITAVWQNAENSLTPTGKKKVISVLNFCLNLKVRTLKDKGLFWSLFQLLTCQELCMIDEFHEQVHRIQAIAWELHEVRFGGP